MSGKPRPPSDRFIRLMRDPVKAMETLNKPIRVERTAKAPGDVVI